MFVLKDYAPYFAQKEEWKKELEKLNVKVARWLFALTIVICVAELFIK